MHVDSLVEYIGPYILQAYESWEIDPHHKKIVLGHKKTCTSTTMLDLNNYVVDAGQLLRTHLMIVPTMLTIECRVLSKKVY